MTDRLFITSAEVAQLPDLPAQGFLARRAALTEDADFPEPMPHSRRPFRWRRDRVLAWIAEQGLPRAAKPQGSQPGGNLRLLQLARTA